MGGGGKIAIGGGAGLIIVIISLLLGQNPLDLINAGGGSQAYEQQQPISEEENQQAEFVRVVLKDTEDVWHALFQERGETYQEPKLVLFTGSDQSGCGMASAAMRPFYCPLDSKVYID
jgi:predicted metalloprotease